MALCPILDGLATLRSIFWRNGWNVLYSFPSSILKTKLNISKFWVQWYFWVLCFKLQEKKRKEKKRQQYFFLDLFSPLALTSLSKIGKVLMHGRNIYRKQNKAIQNKQETVTHTKRYEAISKHQKKKVLLISMNIFMWLWQCPLLTLLH